jgi:predicted DCC family thiol-disulfide oxidoreductase YuxK
MTDALAARCARAVHVITPEGAVLSGGRASLYVLDRIGWHTGAAVGSAPALVWLVELGYRLIASHRRLASRFLFRERSRRPARRSPDQRGPK